MRLKEIEARLAEIKEELNTRAAELTDEEITKLETEVTDLQEERTALLAAAEKRKKLLERIAAGEPTGGAGADTTLLRNFKGAGGAGAGEPEDKYDTTAYRKAFMNYVCRGVAIPAEYRAAETTTTADSGAVIPTTIMNEIIQKLESYGSIYAKVRKINVQGGVSIPIADLKPTAHWITEAKSSDDQKASAKNSVTFNYYGLECKISQSILANVVTLKMFTDLFVPMATEAMVKAIEIAIFNGTGEGQPLGVLKDSRVTAVITLTPEEYASWNGWHKVKGKMKKAYRNGSFVMNQSTFDTGIDGMEDKNGQPIGRTNYGVNGEETYRFMGKNVETVEDDVLPSWDDANEGDVIAVFMNFSDYVINTNMEMQVVKWTDHDNKHELGVEAYIRYMDDFVILSPDKEQLRSWLARIEQFLREELKLEFNPKTTILAAKNGIDFVGYKHRATHRKVRKDSIKRIKRTIKKCESGKITKEQLQKSIQSWTGHAGHADSYNLRKKIETLAEAAIEKAA